MFTKILVPLDLNDSKLAKAALDKAVALAKASNAELRLLYVMPVVPSTYLEYVPVNFEAGEKTRVEQELETLANSFDMPKEKVSSVIRNGGVYHEVLAEADACHADLIVTGSHWPTLATYLIGSHATSIARHAHCSVLVVRGEGL